MYENDDLRFNYNSIKKIKKNAIEQEKYENLDPKNLYDICYEIAVNKEYFKIIVDGKIYNVAIKGAKNTFKSRDTALAFWYLFLTDRESNFIILRRTYTQHKNTTYKAMRSVLEQIEKKLDFKISKLITWIGKSRIHCGIFFDNREIRFGAFDQQDTLSSSAFDFGYCKKLWFEEPVEQKLKLNFNEQDEITKLNTAINSFLRGNFQGKQVIKTFNSWDCNSYYNTIYDDFPYNDEIIITNKQWWDKKIDLEYENNLGKALFRVHLYNNPYLTTQDKLVAEQTKEQDLNYFLIAVEGRDGILTNDSAFPFLTIFQNGDKHFCINYLKNYKECCWMIKNSLFVRVGLDWGTNKFNSSALSFKVLTKDQKILNLGTELFDFTTFKQRTDYANLLDWVMETIYNYCSLFRIEAIQLVISHEQFPNIYYNIKNKWHDFLQIKADTDPDWYIDIQLEFMKNVINLSGWSRIDQLQFTIDLLLSGSYYWYNENYDQWWMHMKNIECEINKDNELKIIEKSNYQRLDVFDAEKMAEILWPGTVKGANPYAGE